MPSQTEMLVHKEMLIPYSLAKQGVKEEPAKPKEVRSAGKAGWLKKSSGKFLSSYKDRYIQLDRTVIEVYENEVSLLNHDKTLTIKQKPRCTSIMGFISE